MQIHVMSGLTALDFPNASRTLHGFRLEEDKNDLVNCIASPHRPFRHLSVSIALKRKYLPVDLTVSLA
jgi:hypothetical protein